MKLLAMAIGLVISCPTQAQGSSLSPAAAKFLRNGPGYALSGCDLWRARCRQVNLQVLESGDGEANDVARHWAKMIGPGVSVDVIFEMASRDRPGRPHPLIDRLEVTARRWPLLSDLRIGDSKARVFDALGEPTQRIEGCWRYADAPDDVWFCFEGDRLKSVTWAFFND